MPLEALSGHSLTIRQAEEKLRECSSHGLYDPLATNVKRQQTLGQEEIKMKGFVFFVVVLTLIGCAPTVSVTKMGLDIYHVQAMEPPNQGGVEVANTLALEEANRHCLSMNKVIFIKDTRQNVDWGVNDIIFRCFDND